MVVIHVLLAARGDRSAREDPMDRFHRDPNIETVSHFA